MEPTVPDAHDKPPEQLTPEQLTCHAAIFDTQWPQPSTAVVSARGELDAANGNSFVDYALRKPEQTQWLIIDLTGLSFFGSAGFSALHTLNVQCAGNDIRWALVPSLAVDRLLRICDPDSTLPICVDVPTAMTAVHNDPPRLLELIPEPR
jgi:anti-anti-sigma factor